MRKMLAKQCANILKKKINTWAWRQWSFYYFWRRRYRAYSQSANGLQVLKCWTDVRVRTACVCAKRYLWSCGGTAGWFYENGTQGWPRVRFDNCVMTSNHTAFRGKSQSPCRKCNQAGCQGCDSCENKQQTFKNWQFLPAYPCTWCVWRNACRFWRVAPIVSLFRFDTKQKVLRRANNTSMGLTLYVFTQNADRIWRVMEGIETGNLGMNIGLTTLTEAPFSGLAWFWVR